MKDAGSREPTVHDDGKIPSVFQSGLWEKHRQVVVQVQGVWSTDFKPVYHSSGNTFM